jgi:hypothetical protein
MTKSFDEATSAIAEPSTETAEIAAPQALGSDFQGEIDQSDIATPRLDVVQKIGALSEEFPAGTILLNRRVVLAEPSQPASITVVTAKKFYMEDLEWGAEERPRIFMTKDDVKAAGLTLDWADGVKPTAKNVLDCLVLAKAPEGSDAPEFNLSFDGERYAVAQWVIQSASSYNGAGKSLLTAKTMYLKQFAEQEFLLSADKKKLGGNMVYVPDVKQGKRNSEEFIQWATTLLN